MIQIYLDKFSCRPNENVLISYKSDYSSSDPKAQNHMMKYSNSNLTPKLL